MVKATSTAKYQDSEQPESMKTTADVTPEGTRDTHQEDLLAETPVRNKVNPSRSVIVVPAVYDKRDPPFPIKRHTLADMDCNIHDFTGYRCEDLASSPSKSSVHYAFSEAAGKLSDPGSPNEWYKLFTASLQPKTKSQNYVRTLLIRLAWTTPEFFPTSEWASNRLTYSEKSVAWIAAQKLLGSLWSIKIEKTVLADGEQVKRISEDIVDILALFKDDGFTPEELAEDPSPVTEFETQTRESFQIYKPIEVTSDDWKETFDMVMDPNAVDSDSGIIRSFGLRLILTDPRYFKNLWKKKKLQATPLTKMWKGAVNSYGGAWTKRSLLRINDRQDEMANDTDDKPTTSDNQEEYYDPAEFGHVASTNAHFQQKKDSSPPQMEIEIQESSQDNISIQSVESNIDKGNASPEKKKRAPASIKTPPHTRNSVHFKQNTLVFFEKESTTANPKTSALSASKPVVNPYVPKYKPKKYFLNKPKKKQQTSMISLKTAHQRAFTTFAKAKLPVFQYELNDPDSWEETLSHWTRLTDILYRTDPKLIVYPWNNTSPLEPLSQKSTKPQSKVELSKYMDRLFVKKGESAWIRLRIGHNSKFIWDDEAINQTYKDNDMICQKDGLQCAITGCAGWLLGSHPSTNCKDLSAALLQDPDLQGFQIEIRFHAIRLTTDRSLKIPANKLIKACHVHTDFNTVGKVKQALNKLYGHSNKEGFPLATVLRFVPSTSDSRYPVSTKTQMFALKCLAKQKNFLLNSATATNSYICGLDYEVPSLGGLSLREAIMLIRHPDDATKTLFIAVSDSAYTTTFLFRTNERVSLMARNLVPVISVVMEAKYGPAAWNWFTEDAKIRVHEFFWDDIDRVVRSNDEQAYGTSKADLDLFLDDSSLMETYGGGGTVDFVDIPVTFLEKMSLKQQFNDTDTVATFHTECNKRATYGEDEDDIVSSDDSQDSERSQDVHMSDSFPSSKETTISTISTAAQHITSGQMNLEQLQRILSAHPELAKQAFEAAFEREGGDQK